MERRIAGVAWEPAMPTAKRIIAWLQQSRRWSRKAPEFAFYRARS